MWRRSIVRVAVGIVSLLAARGASGQQLAHVAHELHRDRASSSTPIEHAPSGAVLARNSVGLAVVGALLGFPVGFLVDNIYCQHRHGDEETILFGPCFMYTAAATRIGLLGGGVVGATLGAERTARRRGCPRRAAVLRAGAGALVGVAPGIGAVLSEGEKYSAERAAAIMTAPILAGLGAGLAVLGCRGS